MKLKLFTLIIIVLSLALIGCSAKDDDSKIPPLPIEQRLVKSIVFSKNPLSAYDFTYDDQNRITKISKVSSNSNNQTLYKYQYIDDESILVIDANTDQTHYIELNKSGYITYGVDKFKFSYREDEYIREIIGKNVTAAYLYNEKDMSSLRSVITTENPRNGNMKHNNIENDMNCNIDFNHYVVSTLAASSGSCMLHLFDRVGKRTKYLVSEFDNSHLGDEKVITKFTYKTDDRGFINKIIRTIESVKDKTEAEWTIEYLN